MVPKLCVVTKSFWESVEIDYFICFLCGLFCQTWSQPRGKQKNTPAVSRLKQQQNKLKEVKGNSETHTGCTLQARKLVYAPGDCYSDR